MNIKWIKYKTLCLISVENISTFRNSYNAKLFIKFLQQQPSLSQQLISKCKTVDDQKNALNEYLYQIISKSHPNNASKITKILLEMDLTEILLMIDIPDILEKKVKKVLNLLTEKVSNLFSQPCSLYVCDLAEDVTEVRML